MARMSALRGAIIPLSALVLFSPLLTASSVQASRLPPGYSLDPVQLSAARPANRVDEDGDFTTTVHRRYGDATESRLLGIAESLYPLREAILERAIDRQGEIGADSAGVSLWWQDGLGVSRVPYAVTAGALAYYVDLTDRFRTHNFRGAWDHNLFWSDFQYDASIEHRDVYYLADTTLTNVYVAEMRLSWSFDDGTFVPVSQAHRFVLMTGDGTVLNVSGDGYVDEQVTMSTHRGIGRVHTLMR